MRRARVRHFVYMEIIRGCQMETITSRENAKIKYACRLREEEKLRTADGLFFAEGPKLCLELARGCTLQTLYATEKALAHTPELEAFAGKTVLVTEPVAQKLSGTKTSQDVFGVFEHPGWQAADILAKGRRILALEAVQDPGNVGTLLRSAAAFGFDGVLLSKGCAAPFAPKTLRASMGAAGRLPVAPVQDLPQALQELRITASDLMEALRGKEYFSPAELLWATVEPNGSISTAPVPQNSEAPPMLPLLLEGTVYRENLAFFGVDEPWLDDRLAEKQLTRPQVLLLLYNGKDLLIVPR